LKMSRIGYGGTPCSKTTACVHFTSYRHRPASHLLNALFCRSIMRHVTPRQPTGSRSGYEVNWRVSGAIRVRQRRWGRPARW
jgi:hypothetical protein